MPAAATHVLRAWLSSFTEDVATQTAPETPAPEPTPTTTPPATSAATETPPPDASPVAPKRGGTKDPIAGGQPSVGPAQDAMDYPVTGIINDKESKTYLMAPDYWVQWGRVENPGWPTKANVPAPPAVWWQQRDRWNDEWTRLDSGNEGQGMRWYPRRSPEPKSKSMLGGLMGNNDRWWSWLEGREKPKKGGGGLAAAAKAAAGVPDASAGGTDKQKAGYIDEAGAKKEADKAAEKEGGGKKEPAGAGPGGEDECKLFGKGKGKGKDPPPGCFCPGPRCVYPEEGFFGGAAPEQLAWENKHMMRRQTLPGLSDAISHSPTALRKATVRLERTQEGWGKQPATLDPRPPQPVENPWVPLKSLKNQPKLKPYEGSSGLLGAAKDLVGKAAMDELIGANMLELKAFMRLQNQSHGEWLPNLMKYKKAQQHWLAGEQKAANEVMGLGKEEQAIVAKRKKKRTMKAAQTEEPPEPMWQPPPPQRYEDLYEMKYRKFWPAMEVLARRAGSGPGRMIEELGNEWRSARLAPPSHPDVVGGIFESASADLRGARAALGGPSGREEEAIDAVDMVLPVPQPELRQARPMDRSGFPTPMPAANVKAYIAKDVPPAIPVVMNRTRSLEKALEESRQAQRALQPPIDAYQAKLDEMAKESKGAQQAQAQVRADTASNLQEVQSKQRELMGEGDSLMDKIRDLKKVQSGDRFVQMHPAGRSGGGVEAKVLLDSVRPLYPQFDRPPEHGPTTYSGMDALASSAGAVLLSTSWNDIRSARMHSSPGRHPGRRRPCGAEFL